MTFLWQPFDKDDTRKESKDRGVMNPYMAIVRSLGKTVVQPGGRINEEAKADDGVFVPSGQYGGMTAAANRGQVGFAPGALVTKPIEVTGKTILYGASLRCDGDTPAVTVKTGGYLVIRGCHITKGDNEQGGVSTYILIEDGGFAMVDGCMFHGQQSDTGSLVRNDNPAVAPGPGRVAVVGCVNATDVVTSPFVNISFTQYVPA